MRKYWNALRHGGYKIKLYLWSVILLTLTAVGCLLYTILTHNRISGIAALFLAVLDLVVIQSVSLRDAEQGKKNGKAEDPMAPDNPMNRYDKNQINKLFSVHRVKKNPRPVMVDVSARYRLQQCPAYIWKDKGSLHFLCLGDDKADEFTVDLKSVTSITLKKGVPGREDLEYRDVKKSSFVRSIFEPFLPSYYEMNKKGRIVSCKNLYVIQPDIAFTNTSAANLFQVLDVDFTAEDEILSSSKFDLHFKELYKYNLLWKDGVLDPEEYKKQCQRILKAVVELADGQELEEKLDTMIRYRLVTEEYADFYGKK